jgi:hypothetical protein
MKKVIAALMVAGVVIVITLYVFMTYVVKTAERCLVYHENKGIFGTLLVGKVDNIAIEEDWIISNINLCGKFPANLIKFEAYTSKVHPLFFYGKAGEHQGYETYEWLIGEVADYDKLVKQDNLYIVKILEIHSEESVLKDFHEIAKEITCEKDRICKSQIDFYRERE